MQTATPQVGGEGVALIHFTTGRTTQIPAHVGGHDIMNLGVTREMLNPP